MKGKTMKINSKIKLTSTGTEKNDPSHVFNINFDYENSSPEIIRTMVERAVPVALASVVRPTFSAIKLENFNSFMAQENPTLDEVFNYLNKEKPGRVKTIQVDILMPALLKGDFVTVDRLLAEQGLTRDSLAEILKGKAE